LMIKNKMCFGNRIGFKFDSSFDSKMLFQPAFGGLILELKSDVDSQENLANLEFVNLGNTILEEKIIIDKVEINLEEAISTWSEPLEDIFPTKVDCKKTQLDKYKYDTKNIIVAKNKVAKPRVLIPVFPGTNSEYDSAKIFEKAGAITNTVPVRNLTPKMLEETIDELAMNIKQSQIIFIPGGFSAGDEPEGSGKFIATMFRNPKIKEAVSDLLNNRDGLILGICNGFQALIKLGLLPYGEIREIDETTPTLTFNKIGRHISKIVYTKTVSNLSPWLNNVKVGTVQAVPISHGEGRFVASNNWLTKLKNNGQIATQYVDFNGNPTMDVFFNPNSSDFAVEGITSSDGRILGKMGHNERLGNFVGQNIPGNKQIKLFEAGVEYFK